MTDNTDAINRRLINGTLGSIGNNFTKEISFMETSLPKLVSFLDDYALTM